MISFKHYREKIANSRLLSFRAVIWELLILGPFAIPMLWLSPKFSRTLKWILSIVVVLLAIILTKYSADLLRSLSQRLAAAAESAGSGIS